MAKESLLDRLRSKPTEAPDEEGKLRKELMELRIQHSSGQLKDCLLYTSDAADES